MDNINRREAIKRVALMMGGTIALPNILKAHESSVIENPFFSITSRQESILAEMAETIIPTTDTPGAKAAEVPKFIAKMLADCYEKKDSDAVLAGLTQLDADTKTKYSKGFVEVTDAERSEMLKTVEASKSTFWRIAKELTVLGYFTSEIGCTQALRYEAVPGKYIGDLPYKKGDKAWAT